MKVGDLVRIENRSKLHGSLGLIVDTKEAYKPSRYNHLNRRGPIKEALVLTKNGSFQWLYSGHVNVDFS